MSASPMFSSAAMGRPFLFPAIADAAFKKPPVNISRLLSHLGALPKLSTPITPASRLEVLPAPEMASTGIPELDALTGGLPRGCLTEICGAASTGRTGILLAALAHATQHGEVCALVDASDAMDPASAAAAGIEMGRLLWIRCGKNNSPRRHTSSCGLRATSREQTVCSKLEAQSLKLEPYLCGESRFLPRLEQVLKVTDLLLQSNGFGLIALDLANIPIHSARRIPLASWFRFRRAIEHTPTMLLVIEQQPIAGSCSSVLLRVAGKQVAGVGSQVSGRKPSAVSCQPSAISLAHAELLDEFEIEVELLRSRLERKPVRSAVTCFRSQAAWTG